MAIPENKIQLRATILAGGGYLLTSPAPGDMMATPLALPGAVGAVADLNGDGFADLIVGTPGSDDKDVDAGRIFITLGQATAGSTQDASHGTPNAIVIDGVSAGDMAGFSVGSLHDLNGDGRDEILVGAPGMAVGAAGDAGAGFVLWGKANGGAGSGIDLADPFAADGSGYAIKGQAAGDMAGWTMTSVGDQNGDGKADVLIGAPGNDAGGGDAGAAYVVWGKSSGSNVLLNTVAAGSGGFVIRGAAAGDRIGEALAALADQNGDGRAEILVGSATAGGGAGAVWVVDGKADGTRVNLASLTAGYKITGEAGSGAGASVADAGDINGDGRHDLLIGGTDAAYLVYGQAGHGDVQLADVAAGNGGVKITGGDLRGLKLLGNADLNQDGVADLILGTPHDAEGGTDAGAVYVIWGDQLYRPVDLAEIANSIGGAKIVGSAGSLTGASLAISADLSGDGRPDLVIGAPGTGEAVNVLYTPDHWQRDPNTYGSAGADAIGMGYGGPYHSIGSGNDSVMGLDGNDTISTGAGDDTIDGGSGKDRLLGGQGNDVYVIESTTDVIVETANNGTDTVRSAVNASLAAHVENLILTGTAQRGTGNDLNNRLTGTAGANVLNGAAGDDTMTGGQGDDTYFVASADDVIVERAGGGTDTVRSTIDYRLGNNLENLQLDGSALSGTGNAAANVLTGNAGNNLLNGKAGADTLRGLAGDDTYFVDSTLDQVQENAGAGNDTVFASADFTLQGELETLILARAGLRGTGSETANRIVGSAGSDRLDGGLGADTLVGGDGDDTYFTDGLDSLTETATGGIDTVYASVDLTLGNHLENLVLEGAARAGTGNGLNNMLTGTDFADRLNGAAGADTMSGGLGDDIYRIDNAADVVVETGGRDTVMAAASWTMADGVEVLTLTKSGLTGTGNAEDNVLNGSKGADTLIGGAGNDTLNSGGGIDSLNGGSGDDTYVLSASGTTITDSAGIDTVILMKDGITFSGHAEIIRLGGTAHSLTGSTGDNRLEGGAGNDSIDGGAGDDLVLAGEGDDDIIATAGNDTLSGGTGDDRYHIHGAAAEIEDFLGHDTLDASDGTMDEYIDLSGDTDCIIENEHVHLGGGGSTVSPLDVQFLQDLTGSFADDIATVRGLVPQVVAALQAVQSNVTFGVSSFVDKPISPFGVTGEWVYRLEQALSADAATLAATYGRISNLSGADAPESQLEALMQLALHANETGFRADSARFVVLFTDAPFHVAGDGAAAGIVTPNNGDAVMDGGGLGEDYPMIAQLAAALQAAGIIPIFAVAGGFEATYQGLVTELGRGAVVSLTSDSSNIVDAITTGIGTATRTHIEDAIGGSGDDSLIGSQDDNALTGGLGNDSLTGAAGDDDLIGGAGADRLDGGDDDDLLNGGAGADTLTGGLGSDTFVFAQRDSLRGSADLITDFTTGTDHIDLSAIDADTLTLGNQTFHFIDGAAFTDAAGELRLVSVAGEMQLQGDMTGDGIADFVLRFDLTSGTAPVLADLIL